MSVSIVETKQVFIKNNDQLRPAIYYDMCYYYTSRKGIYKMKPNSDNVLITEIHYLVNMHIPALVKFNNKLCVVNYIHNSVILIDVDTSAILEQFNVYGHEIFAIYAHADNVYIGNNYYNSIVQHLKFINNQLLPVHIYKCDSDPIPINVVNGSLYIYNDVEAAFESKLLENDSEITYITTDTNVYLYDLYTDNYFIYDYNSVTKSTMEEFNKLDLIHVL